MSESIRNPAVFRNINKLRDRVADVHFKGDKVSILIDCESGEFSIPKSIGDLEASIRRKSIASHGSHQFKHAELKILQSDHGQISFEWADSDWQSSLSEKAVLLLQETLRAINHCGQISKSGSVKEVLLACVRSLKHELPEEIAMQSAWMGELERIPAEKLLSKSAPGTYILRKGDEYTKEIEGNLAEQDSLPVRCFVLTLAESHGKISDRILIQRPSGWAIFNDDLLLGDYRFKTLSEVISQAGGSKPISQKRAA